MPYDYATQTVNEILTNLAARADALEGAVTPAPDTTGPTITSIDPSGTYAEGAPISGTFTTADPDDVLAITGDHADAVTFDPATGEWSLQETDYERQSAYDFAFVATDNAGNSSQQVVAIAISNVAEQPSLSPLSLSATQLTQNEPATINILGATAGSTITGTPPDGMVLDSAARTITGTPTVAGNFAFALTETLADSANSPRVSNVSIEVVAAQAAEPIILAVMAGQSNMNGRNFDDGLTTSISDGYEYVSDPAHANFQTIQPISGQLNHVEAFLRTGPDEQIVADLKAANPDAKIVAVPCAYGGIAIIGGEWLSSATDGAGGLRFEEMIDRANEAHAAALAQWPGAAIEVQIYFVQGEQDANNGQTKAAYLSALSDWITHARSRITGAANAPFIMGSMLPQKWIESSPNYIAAYAAINEAHVALSLNDANAFYARGPDDRGANDNLHYQPASVARAFGTRMATWNSDSIGPNVTNPDELGAIEGTALATILTHDDLLGHATFAITGGADAALFEISDPYLNPTLRWVGDGTGPAAGSYAVEVSARDGFGNVGPAKTFAVTVAGEISPASYFVSGDRGYVVDLNDMTTLWQDREGTIPVTAAGQPVGRVADKSLNGWVLQADANNTSRPTYQTDASGNGYLEFAGGQYLRSANEVCQGDSGTTAWTCAAAIVLSAQSGEKNIIGDQADSTSSFLDFLQADNSDLKSNGRLSGDQFPAFAIAGAITGAPIIAASQYDAAYEAAGVFRPLRVRNASATAVWTEENGGPEAGFANTCTKFVLGARYFSSASNQVTGRIGSFFIIDRALPDADRAVCEAWVAGRSEGALA